MVIVSAECGGKERHEIGLKYLTTRPLRWCFNLYPFFDDLRYQELSAGD